MPTPEEIKKIAEQYSEFTDGSPADKAYIRVIAQCFTEWLSKDYCIVPKSELVELIAKNKYYKDYDSLSRIFPEDLIPERTDWDSMRSYADGLYYLIDNIMDIFGTELF